MLVFFIEKKSGHSILAFNLKMEGIECRWNPFYRTTVVFIIFISWMVENVSPKLCDDTNVFAWGEFKFIDISFSHIASMLRISSDGLFLWISDYVVGFWHSSTTTYVPSKAVERHYSINMADRHLICALWIVLFHLIRRLNWTFFFRLLLVRLESKSIIIFFVRIFCVYFTN